MSDQREIHWIEESTRAVIRRYELSDLEFCMLRELLNEYGGAATDPEYLATYPEFIEGVDVSQQVIADCLAKGWIKVLTLEDCRRDQERFADSTAYQYQGGYGVHPWDDSWVGSLGFSQEGGPRFCQVLRAINAEEGNLSYYNKAAAYPPVQNKLIFEGAHEPTLREFMEFNLKEPGRILRNVRQIRIVDEQFINVGPTWVNHFDQVESFYRLEVTFEVLSAGEDIPIPDVV